GLWIERVEIRALDLDGIAVAHGPWAVKIQTLPPVAKLMVAQTLLHPVSGRNTSIITRRQSQPGWLQYNSTNPYSPSGRSCRCGTVTDLVSRAPSSGNRSIKGIMGMDSSPGS